MENRGRPRKNLQRGGSGNGLPVGFRRHTLIIQDRIFEQFKEICDEKGLSLSIAIEHCLQAYINKQRGIYFM